jgi:enoyl-CoA hydratase
MELKHIRCETQNAVAVLTLSRPAVLNALNTELISELDRVIDCLRSDSSLRVAIITGDGPKAFVAGADISEMAAHSSAQALEMSRHGQEVFAKLEALPLAVIAAVNGYALGGGCELAMACDIRLASDNARFGQPEVSLGLIPGYGGTQRLTRLCGLGAALQLMMSGETIGAEEALRIGLVQKVCPQAELMTAARALADRICLQGPVAVQLVKRVAREGLEAGFAAGCRLEAESFAGLFAGTQAREGMRAFVEKRKAEFQAN